MLRSRRVVYPLDFLFHMHVSTEFIYINEGALQLDFPSGSEILNKGDFAVIFPYVIHGYTTLKEPLDYSLAICSKELTSSFNDALFNKIPKLAVVKAEQLPPDVATLMDELAGYDDENNFQLTKAITSLLLARTLPLMTLQDNSLKVESNIVVQAVSYVFKHFREDISLETVAHALGVSRYTVSRIFTSVVKLNFVNYVNSLRVDCAKEMLGNTSESISQIALGSGFDCVRTFNRIFKKHTGKTPFQYRKSIQ